MWKVDERGMLEIVKDKHPFCPRCGKKRGVTIRKETFPVGITRITIVGEERSESQGCEMKERFFICCENCHRRWQLVDFGVWSDTINLEDVET